MSRPLSKDGKQVVYDGFVFTRDKKTGYYLSAKPLCNNKRIMLHRYVWIKFNCEIPDEYSIHHIDENKENNDISNLKLMSTSKHATFHSNEKVENNYEQIRERFLNATQEKAKEWHKSEEGHEWHKAHVENSLAKTWERNDENICLVCGEVYKVSPYIKKRSKFCSNKCYAKHRRDSGIDDEIRNCVICNKEFKTNKYEDNQTCCRKCAGILTSISRGDGIHRLYKDKID